ncbi:MAG: hypothetical protein GY810_19300 [Aureispira sp.]|nr:hypothetical protein [Aureispira sp.]
MQKFIFIFFILIITQACTVKFTTNAVDYDVIKTFSVQQFDTKAAQAPPTAGQQFSEQLKNKILSDTRLSYLPSKGDIQFKGDVVGYQIAPVAPGADQVASFQRLTVRLKIDLKNIKDKENINQNWNNEFSRFADFAADEDLSSVEDQLIQEIYDQVMEDVFNKAFAGW